MPPSLVDFPEYIEVTLSDRWQGTHGLDEGTVVLLQKVPDQDYWSEDASFEASADNLLMFRPQAGAQNGFWSYTYSVFSGTPCYASYEWCHSLTAGLPKVEWFAFNTASTSWTNLIEASNGRWPNPMWTTTIEYGYGPGTPTPATPTADYTFGDLFNAVSPWEATGQQYVKMGDNNFHSPTGGWLDDYFSAFGEGAPPATGVSGTSTSTATAA